ncbi:MAG: DUF2167 domain-containing protein [Nitrospinota bacterium]|nr:DUF2167 domain-containing protein [Nitrospinota bacterium]
MKIKYTLIAVSMILSMASATQAVTPDLLATQRAINEEVISLPWKYELKSYSLEQSNSTFHLAKGYSLLMGDAARHYNQAIQGAEENSNTEALVFNHNTGVQLIFNYHPDGYVSLEDWGKLNADVLMQEISDNAKKINAERAKHNILPLSIGDWLQKPRLNQDNHSVSWVFDVVDGEETKVNAVTIKLGRDGYEKITWVSSFDNYLKSMDAMPFLVDQYKFNEGHRYTDYSVGDHVAALGIANLVAITAGGNPQKAGIAAFYAEVTLISEKLMMSAVVVLGTFGAFFRRRFSARNQKFQTDPVLVLNFLEDNPSDRYMQQGV